MIQTIYDLARQYINKYRKAASDACSFVEDEEDALTDIANECDEALAWVDRLQSQRDRLELEVARGR